MGGKEEGEGRGKGTEKKEIGGKQGESKGEGQEKKERGKEETRGRMAKRQIKTQLKILTMIIDSVTGLGNLILVTTIARELRTLNYRVGFDRLTTIGHLLKHTDPIPINLKAGV